MIVSNKQKQLTARLLRMLDDYRNPYHMATANGDCPTLVYRGLRGEFSPTLYKKYVRPTPRKRPRLIIPDPTGKLTAAMESQRGSQSREDYQRHLLALDIGELPF